VTIRGRLATSLAVLLTVLLTGALTSGPMSAAPAAAEDNCFRPQEDQAAKPDMWAQRRLGLSRIRPLTTGKGVVVAVIDSGIDVTRQHLAGQGKVIAGRDVLGAPGGPSTRDCNGHGTGVAAILAGRSVGGLPFAGVAPDATLLSIRAVEKGASKETNRGSTAQLVAALAEAVAQHARVINISAGIQRDDPALRAAVRDTLAHDIVIVASAGNDDQDTTRKPEEARKPYYPAAYPGVIAVAATDKVDQRSDISHVGSYVDIAAPGEDVMTVAANGPAVYVSVAGTSYAAPFVAGTAALVRAYRPRLTQAQVVSRLLATADVPAVGRGTPELGAGIVDPYAAVTAVIPAERAAGAVPPSRVAAVSPATPPVVDHRARDRALAGAGLAGLLAVVVLAVAALFPRGRERRWRPGRTPPPVGDRPRA